jgi:hypothetical protein
VGTYQLITVPVALVHNDSTTQAAVGVIVSLVPYRGSRALDTIEAPAMNLAPGAVLAVTGNCTDTCTGADHTEASVTVTRWADPAAVREVTVSGTATSGTGGQGQGDATATISATGVLSGALINAFAACYAGNGLIVGGGSTQVVWTGGSSESIDVSVIVAQGATHCDVYASLSSG